MRSQHFRYTSLIFVWFNTNLAPDVQKMTTNEGIFLHENEFDMISSDGSDNVHSDTLQKFYVCLNLGHIPVNKVNSTVSNRRVSIFGDQSIVRQDEIGMTRNNFHGFYSIFNLPPDVDPDTLRITASGEHSITISGIRHNLNVIKTKHSMKNSVFISKGKITGSSKHVQMNIPENIIKQCSCPYIRNAPEQEATSLIPGSAIVKATDLQVLSPEDAEDDSPPLSSNLSSSVQVVQKDLDSHNEQTPASNQNNEFMLSNSSKYVSKAVGIDRKPTKFFKRSRKSKPETQSVGTQTIGQVKIPQWLQIADVKESKNTTFTNFKPKTQNLVDSSSKDKQDRIGTESSINQNIKLPSSEYKVYLPEFQAQDKPNDIKTNTQNCHHS
ncbi:uncharacterized protein [Narcine bancroftii]|uniref:uncharacterized protein isoform X6 n=1 Tax=Narcine bancroftii TaxID=1343680 RepID=UPI00383187C5